MSAWEQMVTDTLVLLSQRRITSEQAESWLWAVIEFAGEDGTMRLIQVKGMWLNPDRVIGVWVTHHDYAGHDEYWYVTLRCEEKVSWQWTFHDEEAAYRLADAIAAQVNGSPRLPKDIPYQETLR